VPRRAHRAEEPVRCAQLALPRGLVAQQPRQPSALDVEAGFVERYPFRITAGSFDALLSKGEGSANVVAEEVGIREVTAFDFRLSAKGAPPPLNWKLTGFTTPHRAHASGSVAPQAPQKRMPCGFSKPHELLSIVRGSSTFKPPTRTSTARYTQLVRWCH
jgi:hypothetical protein